MPGIILIISRFNHTAHILLSRNYIELHLYSKTNIHHVRKQGVIYLASC